MNDLRAITFLNFTMIFRSQKGKIYRPSIRKCKLIFTAHLSVAFCDSPQNTQKVFEKLKPFQRFQDKLFDVAHELGRKSMEIMFFQKDKNE
jgi:hypothetical protein